MSFFLKENVTELQLGILMVVFPDKDYDDMEPALNQKKSKKILYLSLMVAMALGLSACNDSNADSTQPSPPKLNCAP